MSSRRTSMSQDDEETICNSDSETGIASNDDLSTDGSSRDPFVPFEDVPVLDTQIITFRAILIGSLCGALVNASNIYLGLRVGWTSSANILGAIVGFSVLKNSSKFGPHENNMVQTVATASGGMSNVFISAIPALYQLGLLKTPAQDFLRIVTLTAVGGYFGLLSVVPLRKFFIQHVAKDLNLIFPSSMATAITIRSMHSAADGEKAARAKMKTMVLAFVAAMALRVLSQFALGLLWDWHIFAWLVEANITSTITKWSIAAESWGWVLQWSPAMLGSGILVDFGVASSFFAGSILAWGFIGPYLVSHGMAFGIEISAGPKWDGLMSYTSMLTDFANADHPSPRYWLLWPGVACTLVVAFVELACQSSIFWNFSLAAVKTVKSSLSRLFGRQTHQYIAVNDREVVSEKTLKTDEIETWMWLPGLGALIVLAGVVMHVQFDMPVLEAMVALLLSFCMSLVAIQATGATDTTPLNAISKVSQVFLGAITRASGASVTAAQRLNLVGASLTNVGANQGCDLMGDFRVGFLLGTPPRLQYIAQLIGTLVATFVAPAVFVLFATAYPCITSEHGESCEFPGPTVAAWRAVAVAASEPVPPVPMSSAYFSGAMAAIAAVLVLVRNFVCVGKLRNLRSYFPNMMILALAFTLPNPQTGTTMMVGAILAKMWKWKRVRAYEQYAFGVAAGLVAGEGIGGTVNCILSILGVGQSSTGIGCPGGIC